jgi:hypothetical protein
VYRIIICCCAFSSQAIAEHDAIQAKHLDEIERGVDTLRQMAMQMGNTINRPMPIIDDLANGDRLPRLSDRLVEVQQRARRI